MKTGLEPDLHKQDLNPDRTVSEKKVVLNLSVAFFVFLNHTDNNRSVCHLKGHLNTLCYPVATFLTDNESVDDHINVVCLITIDLHPVFQLAEIAINSCPDKALFLDLIKKFAVVTFSAAD